MKTFQPVIKWSGSKRSQAHSIVSFFQEEIDTYYEPFCGGCSVLRALLESDIKVKNYVCSDINESLIELWNVIKDAPVSVIQIYKELWTELNKDNDIDRKRSFFEAIRDRFNKEKSPLDFMFIMRTTTNGMPRYNRNGEFNNSFHITRNGITSDKLEKIVNEWSQLLNKYNVTFKTQSYETIRPNINDFIYLDPPYAGTKGMYYGSIEYNNLWKYLSNINCAWALSFDGIAGTENNTQNIPNIYDNHIYIKSGNSSFRRVIGNKTDVIVYESLYIKNRP